MKERPVSIPEPKQREPEKTYPPISRRELQSYGEDQQKWLGFLKQYDLLPQETTVITLHQNPLVIKHSDIVKRVGRGFEKFLYKDCTQTHPLFSLISIVKKQKPANFWGNATPEILHEELIKANIDIKNPPAIKQLPYNIRQAIKRHPSLKQSYLNLRAEAGYSQIKQRTVSQKEFESYTSEDWLSFFKRYNFIPPETTILSLEKQPAIISKTEVFKKVGRCFSDFVYQKWGGNFEKITEYLPNLSIKVEPQKPKNYWKNMTPEEFLQVLKQENVDLDNPPPFSKLKKSIHHSIFNNPHLKNTYLDLLDKVGKKKCSPIQNINLTTILEQLKKDSVDIKDILEGKLHIGQLSNTWQARITKYGGTLKFIQDASIAVGLPIKLSHILFYKDWSSKMWQEEFARLNLPTNNECWATLTRARKKDKQINSIYDYIRRIGIEKFVKQSDINLQLGQPLPLGWMTNWQMSVKLKRIDLHVHQDSIKRLTRKYKELYPDEFKQARLKPFGKEHECFSPLIAEKIKQAILEESRKQNGAQEKIDSTEANAWLKSLQL